MITDEQITARVTAVKAEFRARYGRDVVREFVALDAYGLAGQGHWYELTWFDLLTDEEREAYEAMRVRAMDESRAALMLGEGEGE